MSDRNQAEAFPWVPAPKIWQAPLSCPWLERELLFWWEHSRVPWSYYLYILYIDLFYGNGSNQNRPSKTYMAILPLSTLSWGTSLFCRKAWRTWMLSMTSAMQCTSRGKLLRGRGSDLSRNNPVLLIKIGSTTPWKTLGGSAVRLQLWVWELLCVFNFTQVLGKSHAVHEGCHHGVRASFFVSFAIWADFQRIGSIYDLWQKSVQLKHDLIHLLELKCCFFTHWQSLKQPRAGKACAVEKKIQLWPQNAPQFIQQIVCSRDIASPWFQSYMSSWVLVCLGNPQECKAILWEEGSETWKGGEAQAQSCRNFWGGAGRQAAEATSQEVRPMGPTRNFWLWGYTWGSVAGSLYWCIQDRTCNTECDSTVFQKHCQILDTPDVSTLNFSVLIRVRTC